MQPTSRPRVKICCISNVDEAWLAIWAGASALGLVSEMPSGPGVIPDTVIAEIAAAVPPGVSSFLLSSRQDVPSIVRQQRTLGVSTIQICDRLEVGSYRDLRQALPGIKLVQVIHVVGMESLVEAETIAPHVDGILLDSGDQSLPVKKLGGTGRTHDWTISRQIREAVEVPIFLAGGLTPDNVTEAIARVGPYALDICSGVRTDGKLDEEKLSRFFSMVDTA